MGLTVLDAGVLIGALDSDDDYHAEAVAELRRAGNARDRLAIPASALAEALVGPIRAGPEAESLVDRFISRLAIEVAPADAAVARMAARLRARHGRDLLLPDALVVATAVVMKADRLVTTDGRWPSATKLGLSKRIVVL